MHQETIRLEKQTYLVHQADNFHWKILVRKDSNSDIYEPVYRKGWQEGGEIEIFSLLPPVGAGDEPLLHIRIYTKASEADQVPPLPSPPISVQSRLPIFTFTEPEERRIRVQLMCTLRLEGRRLKVTPLIEPDDF